MEYLPSMHREGLLSATKQTNKQKMKTKNWNKDKNLEIQKQKNCKQLI
jgi:hypothetical protein